MKLDVYTGLVVPFAAAIAQGFAPIEWNGSTLLAAIAGAGVLYAVLDKVGVWAVVRGRILNGRERSTRRGDEIVLASLEQLSKTLQHLLEQHTDRLPPELRHPRIGPGVDEPAWHNRNTILWCQDILDTVKEMAKATKAHASSVDRQTQATLARFEKIEGIGNSVVELGKKVDDLAVEVAKSRGGAA